MILSLDDHYDRRDFFATNKDIKGIGYKESSHFLRNIGYRGYVILDKHILQTMHELNIINCPKPPVNRDKYLETENKLIQFSNNHNFNIDELDLLIWSEKTGEILK